MTDGGYTAEEAACLQTFKHKDGPYTVFLDVNERWSIRGPTPESQSWYDESGAQKSADKFNAAYTAGWVACLLDYLDAPHVTESRLAQPLPNTAAEPSPTDEGVNHRG